MFLRSPLASRHDFIGPTSLQSWKFGFFAASVFSVLLFAVANESHGEISIEIQDGMIVEGGEATIDVLITTTIANQPFSLFDSLFLIDQSNAAVGTALEYINPQTQAGMQTEAFVDDPRYVFYLDNINTGSDAKAFNVAATTVAPSTTLQVFDQAIDANENLSFYPIEPGDILLQLRLTHEMGGAAAGSAVGNTFAISLDETYVDLEFLDDAGDDIAFVTTPGTITVISAVPEPSSATALAVLLGAPVLLKRRRRSNAA